MSVMSVCRRPGDFLQIHRNLVSLVYCAESSHGRKGWAEGAMDEELF